MRPDEPITPEELHAYLYRLHLLVGPVGIHLDTEGAIYAFEIQHASEEMRYRVVIEPEEKLERFDLRLLHRALASWFHDYGIPLEGKLDWRRPKVAIKRVLAEAVARLSVRRAQDNPLRTGRVEVNYQPRPNGLVGYEIDFGDLQIPGVVLDRGDDYVDDVVKDQIRQYTQVMGELQ